jgi:hypothetical protein
LPYLSPQEPTAALFKSILANLKRLQPRAVELWQ